MASRVVSCRFACGITRHSTGPCASGVSWFICCPLSAQGRLRQRYVSLPLAVQCGNKPRLPAARFVLGPLRLRYPFPDHCSLGLVRRQCRAAWWLFMRGFTRRHDLSPSYTHRSRPPACIRSGGGTYFYQARTYTPRTHRTIQLRTSSYLSFCHRLRGLL